MRLDLRVGIAEAAQRQPLEVTDSTQEELFTFIQRRLEQLLVSAPFGLFACFVTSLNVQGQLRWDAMNLVKVFITEFANLNMHCRRRPWLAYDLQLWFGGRTWLPGAGDCYPVRLLLAVCAKLDRQQTQSGPCI